MDNVTLIRVDGTEESRPYPKTLAEWQSLVGGLIEVLTRRGLVLVVNEEGLIHGMPPNIRASFAVGIPIVGDAVLLGGGALRRWNRDDEADDDEGIDA